MEAKLARALHRLVAENRRLRYTLKVTEAISAKAISKLARRSRIAEATANSCRKNRVDVIEANGKRFPVKYAAGVIESLVRRYHTLQESVSETGNLQEEITRESSIPFTGVRTVEPSSVTRLTESLREGSSSRTSDVVSSQARLGARVAARIGRK